MRRMIIINVNCNPLILMSVIQHGFVINSSFISLVSVLIKLQICEIKATVLSQTPVKQLTFGRETF